MGGDGSLYAVMRTHEGNRPDTNFQYYDDDDCMKQLARLVDIYTMLAPYTKTLVAENAAKGTPVMRPLFLQYEDDPRSYTEQFEYLYGPDLLVAPVWQSGKTEWEVYLPSDEWTHLWTGEHYAKGTHTVPAELGDTPVFCRKGSQWAELFDSIRAKVREISYAESDPVLHRHSADEHHPRHHGLCRAPS